ncbi:hypothetical protein C1I98_13830 [Spongiactinospora gelatinilytica]|uniref:Uncharacterized protein n=1 Tax=Spongiactinospora gelatinilytica TaxID=2666298 RepID=A0A2W2HM09_9ACTN|nr:hypothetical protein C1I98_13830 [Spongiactinospora gelatinilytica]
MQFQVDLALRLSLADSTSRRMGLSRRLPGRGGGRNRRTSLSARKASSSAEMYLLSAMFRGARAQALDSPARVQLRCRRRRSP